MIRQNGHIDQIDNYSSAFEIGSVTKAFTGNVLAQLVIEKKVDLNDTAQKYLPFPLLHSPLFTLKQLAMHTAGLQRMPHDFDTPGDRHRFLGFATVLLAGLSAVATLFAALVVLYFKDCR